MGYPWPKGLKRRVGLKRTAFRSKFNAERGSGFDSKLEKAVFEILKMMEKGGLIEDIQRQVSVDLSCGINWKVDFSYVRKINGERVWVEAKGVESGRYRICKKLWKGGHGPGNLEVWKGRYENPKLVEIVKPKEAL